jgi:hypothetical protein
MGTTAEAIGPQSAVLGGGIICAAFAVWMMLTRPALRGLR